MKSTDSESEFSFYSLVGQMLGLRNIRTMLDLVERLEKGLTVRGAENLRVKACLSDFEMAQLIVSRRILKRRSAGSGRLTMREGDMVLRIARIAVLTHQVFADGRGYGAVWLRQPKVSMGGRMPLQLLQSEIGAMIVEEHLTAITEGVFL